MEKQTIFQIGGSLEKAVKGEFTIDSQAILREAWQKTSHSRIAINLGLLFVIMLGSAVMYLAMDYLGGVEAIIEDPEAGLILNVLVTLVIWPFLAGVEMMGVLNAVGMKIKPQLTFSFLKRGSWVALCALLSSLFVSIGLQLLIIPGIFLLVAFSLVIPLVVEKKMTPIQAMIISVKALRFQWFKIFYTYLILVSAFVVSLLPLMLLAQSSASVIGGIIFFFSLSYIAPLYYNVKGILYREIFGLQLLTVDGKNPPPSQSGPNDSFTA